MSDRSIFTQRLSAWPPGQPIWMHHQNESTKEELSSSPTHSHNSQLRRSLLNLHKPNHLTLGLVLSQINWPVIGCCQDSKSYEVLFAVIARFVLQTSRLPDRKRHRRRISLMEPISTDKTLLDGVPAAPAEPGRERERACARAARHSRHQLATSVTCKT